MANVGDSVKYVPHVDHALDRIMHGTSRYCFFLSTTIKNEEITDEAKVHNAFRSKGKDAVKIIGPKYHWDATITAIDEETGKASLRVKHPNPGIYLNYDDVPMDGKKIALHSWYEE